MLNYPNCKGRLNGKTGDLKSGQSYDKNRKKNIQTPFELKEQEFGLEMENYSFGTTCNIIIMMFGLSFTNKCYSI